MTTEDKLAAAECLQAFIDALTDRYGDNLALNLARGEIRTLVGPEAWYRAQVLVGEINREPTDHEIYNRHGMEGGIAYKTPSDEQVEEWRRLK